MSSFRQEQHESPDTLISFMHPQHELRLVFKKPEHTHRNRRICDICYGSAEGLYYQCEPCGFYVHPFCLKLPQHVKHVPHPAHILKLSHEGASNKCMVCHGAIRSWRYKCGPCRFDIHMECVYSSASSQPHFHPSQSHQPPYNQGHTNQGQAQGVRPGISTLLLNFTVAVISSIIAGQANHYIQDFF